MRKPELFAKPKKILKIVGVTNTELSRPSDYGPVLAQLAIAETQLIRAGKDSAMPHFLAIVKELERYYGFKFEKMDDQIPNDN